jgi:adenylate cyclase
MTTAGKIARTLPATVGDPVTTALDDAARTGFRWMLIGRSVLLAVIFAWSFYGSVLYSNYVGSFLIFDSIVMGLLILWTLGRRHERLWHRYAVVAVDIAALAAAALFLPLSTAGDVPRIFVFRAYEPHYLWLILIVSSLAMSPRLILFAGVGASVALWCVFLVAVSEMDRTVSWADLTPESTAAQYMALLLDPDFIGVGNRIESTVSLLLGTALLSFVVSRARRVVGAYAIEAQRRQHAENLFGRYVPAEIAREIMATPGALKPTVREGTALFVDMEGFTRFAVDRTPDEVLAALDTLLAMASASIARHGGVVVSFGGDSVLATFGVPVQIDNHAAGAVAAADEILAALERGGGSPQPMRVRIGIASGPIAAGSVGSDARQSYTVYGATINLAQRLEQANKHLGTRLLVSSETVAALPEPGRLRITEPLELPGLPEPVAAYTA